MCAKFYAAVLPVVSVLCPLDEPVSHDQEWNFSFSPHDVVLVAWGLAYTASGRGFDRLHAAPHEER